MNVEHAREYQKRIPFIQHLRIHTDELGKGTARLSVPVEAHLMNSLGTVHGGVIMSLLDVALCTAARTAAMLDAAEPRTPQPTPAGPPHAASPADR